MRSPRTGEVAICTVSDRLKQAARAFDDVRLITYEVAFTFRVIE